MKFTLLFYTDGWVSGPTVELSHIPSPGSIVWTGGRRRDDEDSMYYVDNVMYPERGMEREDVVYLYVRPYTGYTRYAPMTEADRLAEKLADIRTVLGGADARLEALHAQVAALAEAVTALRETVALHAERVRRMGEQALQSADVVEDGQQAHIEKLDDIVLALEQIKEQM